MRWTGALALGLMLVGCHSQAGPDKRQPAEVRYLPPGLDGVALGMSYADFQAVRPKAGAPQDGIYDFRLTVVENAPGGSLAAVIYYFDEDLPGQPLYEVIAESPEGVDVPALAQQRLGPPNSGGEWVFTGDAPWPIKAWVFQQKVVVAASMPGTEWDPAQP